MIAILAQGDRMKVRFAMLNRLNLQDFRKLFGILNGFRWRVAALSAIVASLMFAACRSEPADLRNSVPPETLVYLETNDLGNALAALTEQPAFGEAAKAKPDLSMLSGIQIAIAVTGFEAEENPVTPENSVLNFRPRFVAVAETHMWNRSALAFTEERLGGFVNETYGGEVTLESRDEPGGRLFEWKAGDGRRVFAFVSGSRLFFSNDESALAAARAAARGETAGVGSNESLARIRSESSAALAFGYVSPDGVAQIANFAGVSTAIEATEDEDGRGFIARILPEAIRGAVRDVSWTANRVENGIEDRYTLALKPEASTVLRETMVVGGPPSETGAAMISPEVVSATKYNVKNPQIAWRSLVLLAGKSADPSSAQIISIFSGGVLDPYGIDDAEMFLSSVDSEIWTAAFDAEGDKSIAAATVKNMEAFRKSISDIDFSKPAENVNGAEVRKSADGELVVAFIGNQTIFGDAESVAKCLAASVEGKNLTKHQMWPRLSQNGAVATTIGRDQTDKVIDALGEKKSENIQVFTSFSSETRVGATGIERKTLSPFGLLGRIMEQFDE